MKPSLVVAAALSLAVTGNAFAQNGSDIFQTQCIACHTVSKPENLGIEHLWERQGPDLQYAGSKFNQAWLEKWLENPTRMRPAGELYSKHLKATDTEDEVDESTLEPHMKLTAADAKAAAAYLMTMKAPEDLVVAGAYKGAPVSPSMGAMFFTKLRGCGACHTATPGRGGSSGPELITASKRLQPDFIYSYIKHPQLLDPGVWMPTLELSEPDLQRLTGYLVQLDNKGAKP